MSLSSNVTRWRSIAHAQAFWAANRYGVALDESDLLALISVESGGNPAAVSKTGYRGLGQVGKAALSDYNKSPAGQEMPVQWDWLIDPARALEQIRVIAWLTANGRKVVSTWHVPDAVANAALWADARYGWGGGNLKTAIAHYELDHGGTSPTFDELAEFLPDAGVPNVRPWKHARTVHARAEADRGNPTEEQTGGEPSKEDGSVPGVVLALIVIAGLVILFAYALKG